MAKNVVIPIAMQIRVDDVGWHNGRDERYRNRPSRSGLPRNHHPSDYLVLQELGKALDMKIGCSLVIGEWDRENVLRGVPHVTYNEEGWDRASEIDMEYAEECFRNLDGSEYLGYNLHGLLHSYYDAGRLVCERQFFPLVYDEEKGCYTKTYQKLPLPTFEQHLDLFYKIFNGWNFQKKITGFASPCGCNGTPEGNADFCGALRDRGIVCWMNGWKDCMDRPSVDVSNGIVCLRTVGAVSWEVYGADPDLLKSPYSEDAEMLFADFCFHWTNFLHYHPEHNFDMLPKWIAYFNRQAEVFGVMLSRDVPFAASQAVYYRFAKMDVTDTGCVIDMREVDACGAVALKDEFYISLRNGTKPRIVTGGTVELYETRKEFATYKITRDGSQTVTLQF